MGHWFTFGTSRCLGLRNLLNANALEVLRQTRFLLKLRNWNGDEDHPLITQGRSSDRFAVLLLSPLNSFTIRSQEVRVRYIGTLRFLSH